MQDSGILEESQWREIAIATPELEGNPEGAGHLVYRFAGKYLPAVLRARSQEELDRVWLAFWSYLIARPTNRKPFGLSQEAADELIYQFKAKLSEDTERRDPPRTS